MAVKPTRAVVFDLFGTLVPNFSRAEYSAMAVATAMTLSAPIEEFVHLYMDVTYPLRLTGVFATTAANIEHVCEALDIRVAPERVTEAARLRIELTRRTLRTPLPGAVEALSELRASGYGIGLISDCSAEVPLVWPETPLAPLIAAPVFSCQVGYRKPDPRLYTFASEALGVTPSECLYVGDGSGRELSGAVTAGMRVALIRVSYDETTDTDRPEVLAWRGSELSTLSDVPVLAAEGSN